MNEPLNESATEQSLISEWVSASLPRALAYAISLLHDRHLAEDMVQDCFCRLLAKRDQYDLPKDGFKILLRSITNACVDHHRKVKETTNMDLINLQEVYSKPNTDQHPVNPAHQVMSQELETAIGQALEYLPLKQRAALELKGLGCSLAEIALSLKISTSHAGVLIHRARGAMSQALQPFLQAE